MFLCQESVPKCITNHHKICLIQIFRPGYNKCLVNALVTSRFDYANAEGTEYHNMTCHKDSKTGTYQTHPQGLALAPVNPAQTFDPYPQNFA
jgi:hypothetical protein